MKRKKEEQKAIAKIKASKSFQRNHGNLDPEEAEEMAREMFNTSHAPIPGQMENCESCGKRFTVTAYSRAGESGGLLCPACTKAANKDEQPAKKKRKVAAKPANRRSLASRQLEGTYHTGSKNLITLCIETLAKNVDMAEDLGDLPEKLVEKLAAILAKRRLVNPKTLDLFLKPGSDTVTVYEAAKLSSDDFIKIFQIVPTVKHLRLRNAIQFKNKVMDYLIGSPTVLEDFSIHGANLIDNERWNSYLTQKGAGLRSLKVYYTDGHFGDEQLEQLAITCPNLARLKVSHNQQVTDVGIEHIAKLNKLQHLTLEVYKTTSSGPYVDILNSLGARLRTLCMSTIHYLDDSVLEGIHEQCANLEKLRLSENECFTDQGFVNLFTDWNNPPLRHIDLHKCRHVDATVPRDNPDLIGLCSSGFEALMTHSGAELRHLNVHACRHITSEALERVFAPGKVYPVLREIDVSFVWGVNDFVVGSIFKRCPKLKTLKVFGCFDVKSVRVPRGRILIGLPNALGMQIEGIEDEEEETTDV